MADDPLWESVGGLVYAEVHRAFSESLDRRGAESVVHQRHGRSRQAHVPLGRCPPIRSPAAAVVAPSRPWPAPRPHHRPRDAARWATGRFFCRHHDGLSAAHGGRHGTVPAADLCPSRGSSDSTDLRPRPQRRSLDLHPLKAQEPAPGNVPDRGGRSSGPEGFGTAGRPQL